MVTPKKFVYASATNPSGETEPTKRRRPGAGAAHQQNVTSKDGSTRVAQASVKELARVTELLWLTVTSK